MQSLIRQGATILILIGSVGLAAAQGDNSNGTDGATTRNAVSNDFETTPGSNPSPAEPIPGATPQTTPAKISAQNAAKDQIPLAVNDLGLSASDKQAIVQAVARASASTTGSAASGHAVTPPEPGSQLSEFFEMRDLPPALVDQMPALRDHKYVALADRVLLVNPREHIVISAIPK
jgi:hypothetical protein